MSKTKTKHISQTNYSGNNPDKTMNCYPCGCPSCPGFHDCSINFDTKSDELQKCNICGKEVKYRYKNNEEIEKYLDFINKYLPKQKDNIIKYIPIKNGKMQIRHCEVIKRPYK